MPVSLADSKTESETQLATDEVANQEEVAETIAAAQQTITTATDVQSAQARQKAAKKAAGVRIPPVLKAEGGATGLAAFAAYKKGSLAPWWLFQGVCDEWNFDTFTTELRLITVSENATYAVVCHGKPTGVIRVSQPNYVGGPVAVASEIAWLNALHDLEGVNVVDVMPTASGFLVAGITDEAGSEWSCVCTSFVEGVVLEDMPDPSSYYRTIGRWTALFHAHSRAWKRPDGFHRFEWKLTDMVGESPRWGRWEDIDFSDAEFELCKQAESAALEIMNDVTITSKNWGLIHADLRLSNVIAASDGTLTVIDFDDSGLTYFLYDFAAALSFVEHEPYALAMAKEWVAGYQEVAPLSEEDLRQACALSMIRRLQILGWTTNHYPDALPEGLYDAQAPGTVYCAKRFLENPLWLLS